MVELGILFPYSRDGKLKKKSRELNAQLSLGHPGTLKPKKWGEDAAEVQRLLRTSMEAIVGQPFLAGEGQLRMLDRLAGVEHRAQK